LKPQDKTKKEPETALFYWQRTAYGKRKGANKKPRERDAGPKQILQRALMNLFVFPKAI
jgi:hypothetical protein